MRYNPGHVSIIATESPRASLRRAFGLIGGAAGFAALLMLSPPQGMSAPAWRCAATACLMAMWWITEALPVAATALVPVAVFPLLGVSSIKQAAAPYAHPLIFLFLGGFTIALAAERWQLHRRMALRLMSWMGSREDALIGGFMLAGAVLSMWVSNTATAVILLPIATSVIELRDQAGTDQPPAPSKGSFSQALLLGLAYATSIGGLGTLIGTPPNALLAGFCEQTHQISISFARWMLLGTPVAAVMLAATWLLLTRVIFPCGRQRIPGVEQLIGDRLRALGRMTRPEIQVLVVFAVAALLWMSRTMLAAAIPGLPLSDAGIAILAALCLFAMPVDLRRGLFTLEWSDAARLPWGVLLLFGGGLSLASAISDTGLASWIGGSLTALAQWPALVLVTVVVAMVIFLTELTSNTATAATFLPVLSALALAAGHHPLVLLIPATVAASCAFMMPVATPPNAIVFASGAITVPQMARAGLLLNLTAIPLVSLLCYALTQLLFIG